MSNTFGILLKLTTFGESHGAAIGGVLDGMPARMSVDVAEVQRFVNRRRTAWNIFDSSRVESDRVEILSGLLDGKTLGTPIGFIVRNTDARPSDYDALANAYRPSHADFTYQMKYGIRDHRGGGRASARETVARVVAGGIAIQALRQAGVTIEAQVESIGGEKEPAAIEKILAEASRQGDTLGGIVSCVAHGVPAGLGEPVYGKLSARLADAMLSIPAAHGFDYGDGFNLANMRGSEALDLFVKRADGRIGTSTNHSGGIQGGISNGEDITFRVAFKPVATLMREVPTVDGQGNPITLQPQGRHDVCVVRRAVPVVEAMAALVLLDAFLLANKNMKS